MKADNYTDHRSPERKQWLALEGVNRDGKEKINSKYAQEVELIEFVRLDIGKGKRKRGVIAGITHIQTVVTL